MWLSMVTQDLGCFTCSTSCCAGTDSGTRPLPSPPDYEATVDSPEAWQIRFHPRSIPAHGERNLNDVCTVATVDSYPLPLGARST